MAREEARECVRCQYRWWAVRTAPPQKTMWGDDYGLPWMQGGQGTARAVRLSAKRQEMLTAWERWGLCSRCGSQKIKTVSERGFVPTALAEAKRAQAAATPPPPPTQPTQASADTLQVGSRVVIRALGYRGLTGTVVKIGKTDATVDLDNGTGKAYWVPMSKLDVI